MPGQRNVLLVLLAFCKNFIRFEFDETSFAALKKSVSYFLHIFLAPRLRNLLVLSCLGLSGVRKVNKVKFDTFYSIVVAPSSSQIGLPQLSCFAKIEFFHQSFDFVNLLSA